MPHKGRHSRGYLPHIDASGITQFITLRLFDAVPTQLIERWKEELAQTSEFSEDSEERKRQLVRRIARFEDRGHGECFFLEPKVSRFAAQTLIQDLENVGSWVIMPNHIHFLFRPAPEPSLGLQIKNLKGKTAREANKLLNRRGTFWFPDYFDRMIRDEEHLRKTRYYIEQNPVKAGLVPRAEDWQFSSAYNRE